METPRTPEEAVLLWMDAKTERRNALAAFLAASQANDESHDRQAAIEDYLLLRCAGEEFDLGDGRTVVIGRPFRIKTPDLWQQPSV